jgi:hypothetical protein
MSRARKKKDEMNGNAFGVLSPGALAGAERSEGERSEPQRHSRVFGKGSRFGRSNSMVLLCGYNKSRLGHHRWERRCTFAAKRKSEIVKGFFSRRNPRFGR